MSRRIPTIFRSCVLLAAVAFGAAGCVAYPGGPSYGYGGGYRAPAYSYGYGGGYRSAWRAPSYGYSSAWRAPSYSYSSGGRAPSYSYSSGWRASVTTYASAAPRGGWGHGGGWGHHHRHW